MSKLKFSKVWEKVGSPVPILGKMTFEACDIAPAGPRVLSSHDVPENLRDRWV
jgi:hypothetical protein